jgi:rhodanese-related sulfurtransferase
MSSFKLINVLAPTYFQDCHIKGSLNVPFTKLATTAQEWDKHDEIVVYCAHSHCTLSKKAWYLLHGMGFTNVKAFEGGIKEWYQKRYPVQGACSLAFLQEPIVQAEANSEILTITREELLSKIS